MHNDKTGRVDKANSKVHDEAESDFEEADMEEEIPLEGQGQHYSALRESGVFVKPQHSPQRRLMDDDTELSAER